MLANSSRTATHGRCARELDWLTRFERDVQGLGEACDGLHRENLRSLFGVRWAPSDSRMREHLDDLDPAELWRAFKRLSTPTPFSGNI